MSKEKLVPELRFNGFDGEWIPYKLGDIGTFKNGINKSNEDFGSGYSFINLENIFDKDYLLNDDYDLVEVSEKELKEYNLNKGDVLFVRSSVKPTGVGLTTVIGENLTNTVFSGFIIRFRENKKFLDLNFKRYCFNITSFRNSLMSKSTTSANTNINQQSLSKLILNVPSIDEQDKIASFLLNIDKKIELLEKEHQYYLDFKIYLMQQLFSQKLRFIEFDNEWEYFFGKNTFELLGGGSFKSEDSVNDGVLWLKIANVGINQIKTNELSFLPYDYLNTFKKYILKKGDVIIALTRPILDHKLKIAVIDDQFNNSLLNQRVGKITSKDNVDLKFIYYYLQLPYSVYYLESKISGSDPPNLSNKDLLNIPINIPSFDEQQKISHFLTLIDEKIELLETYIIDINIFKKGLLQQMFV